MAAVQIRDILKSLKMFYGKLSDREDAESARTSAREGNSLTTEIRDVRFRNSDHSGTRDAHYSLVLRLFSA